MIYVDNMNTTYQEIITTFVLNIMLYHVDMLWIIENHEPIKSMVVPSDSNASVVEFDGSGQPPPLLPS